MIFLENAESGTYTLKVTGLGKGKYTVVVGQITTDNDYWENIAGESRKIRLRPRPILTQSITLGVLFSQSHRRQFIYHIHHHDYDGERYIDPYPDT